MPYSLQYNKFLIFGDSITEFCYNAQPNPSLPLQFSFGAALTNAYTRRLDIVQRGYGGYNTDQAKIILPRILEREHREDSKILISTLFFGTNDAAHAGPQHVDLDRFVQNTSELLKLFKEKGIKVILIGPAKHNEAVWEPPRPEYVEQGVIRRNETNEKYSNALLKLSKEANVPFVNLYKEFDAREDWRDLLIDGVHFTGEGYRILYDQVIKAINEWYPELAPENLEYLLPPWRDLPTIDDL